MTRAGFFLIFLFLDASFQGSRAALAEKDVEFFENRIRPVLAQECYECHRTGGKKKGGLALDYRTALLEGGDSGAAIVPGKPSESLLIKAIRHEVADTEMPKSRAKLDDAVIADFEKWVKMGAPDPREAPATATEIAKDTDWKAILHRRTSWWSFQPVQKPALPQGEEAHAVDRFVRSKLREAKLPVAPEADRGVLIRRLSFALRGLPPTPEEIKSFLEDKSADAYQKLVDSYLESPHFGERWARHWMDWFRYADSHGSEGDAVIPHAWRYRDYLIRALNNDVPYDQMLREHLAGDQLARPRINTELHLNESALGVAQLRMVFHGYAPTDAMEEQIRFTDDQINVISKATLGLTVSCARCHDHKFDPISQADFYGWYGMFASGAPVLLNVEASDAEVEARRAKMVELKSQIKMALIEEWMKDADTVAARASTFEKSKDPLLQPFSDTNILSKWRNQATAGAPLKRWDLGSGPAFAEWSREGVKKVEGAGSFAIAAAGKDALSGIYPAGVYSHMTTPKDPGVMISPKFALEGKCDLWVRVAGEGGSFLRYVVANYPRDGSVYPVSRLNGGRWQWVKHNLDYWEGDRVHVELTTAADQAVLADVNAARSWFGVRDVRFTKAGSPPPAETYEFAQPVLEALEAEAKLEAVYARALRRSLTAWKEDKATDQIALFLDQALRSGLLRNEIESLESVKPLIAAWREEEGKLPTPKRSPGMLETAPLEQPLLVRGDHKHPAAPVPRHFLDAIDPKPYGRSENARLRFASDLLRPDNPLTARVMVNRVWHHLFGRGIVGTPDNFGRLGQAPTHPELLDFLAARFVENGYSVKDLIRFIVTSETYCASSEPPAGVAEKDPDNLLLSHFRVRRLEAEAIRDSLLAVSGELKDEMYGPPITGKTPRRSVYLRVNRNDLDPFMTAFDVPAPSTSTSKRDVTNVPGQSLLLLNDPFVLNLAERWAERTEGENGSRIEAMFMEAFGRKPEANELERAQSVLEWFAETRAQEKSDQTRLEAEFKEAKDRRDAFMAAAEDRVLKKRDGSSPVGPVPVAAWDFRNSLEDKVGKLHGKAVGGATIGADGLVLNGSSSYVETGPLPATLKAKTLEAWVKLENLEQRGGGVITVQNLGGDLFDAIVFGEGNARHWAPGSDYLKRTRSFDGAEEREAKSNFVHLAIVYAEDGTITGYRNGVAYGKPYQAAPATFEAGKAILLFGNRHSAAAASQFLKGTIGQARLYDRALTAEEVQASFSADANFVSMAEILAAMPEAEHDEFERLQANARQKEEAFKSIKKTAGLSSEWADLAHALFNVKEFVYVR